ncbi:electron transport complex subunit RsxC [Photobacterium leiognathi]|uniref:electron transport complex subunit RsxC n=1 Tax=Photobacterium leiognathi TaxID=553611 RepID=UPI00298115CE|nr:electron transport complex subunit RsxC [Photobacterium leiognathi]
MLSIIEQIKQGKLWDFHGGIHPAENKDLSNKSPIVNAGIPQELVLPLKQHIGSKGDIIVAVGDTVQKGQPLTQGDIAMCVPVHAPTSGTITAIEQRTTAHPSGLSDLCIVIAPDQQDTWCDKTTYADYEDRDPAELIDAIRLSGIAGLGGAGFPTARKLQGGLGNVDILIINAAECEPYITADDRLMRDYAEEVVEGVRILRHIISPKLTIIGIEDNKPEAIKALEQHVKEDDNILIRVVPTKYPSGSSKQLVKILTGREVPSQSRSTSVGVIMQNVGTAFAIKRAIIDGEPLIERVVTLTGEAFKERGNVFAMLGTPIAYLLDKFGYKADKKHPRVIVGGSLMGFTLPHSNVPITKMTNCILAPKRKELPLHTYEMACIRCSACADVCPSSLLPQQLQWYAKDQNYEKCEEYNLQDCIECGACAYVCPSEIPLVQYYRQAKAEIWARSQDEINAERARQRFEAKQARLDRDKAERENRFKKAAETRREEMAKTGGDDAVAAAIARVKAKQAAAQSEKPEVKPAVAAAIAAAKAKQAASAQGATSETLPDNSEMAKLREERKRQARERKAEKEVVESTASASSNDSKKDAVAAAIARAKAKKAQQASEQKAPVADSIVENAEVDPKKATIAAAVARAKAKKEAQQAQQAQSESTSEPVAETEAVDPKKAAIAAAVARAKAKKAAQQAEAQSAATPEPAAETEAVDPKKAAVAAAVARAKARKAAQQAEAQSETTSEPAAETEAVDPKKAAVAAAVARAKARKAAQQAQAQSETTPEPVAETDDVDPKKAAVAAAVARAKARKAAQQAQAQSETTPEPVAETEAVDPKKAAVAAAVARAKARKAAQQAEEQSVTPEPTAETEAVDPKKAAVAAAVARAKARKAAQQAAKEQQNIEED